MSNLVNFWLVSFLTEICNFEFTCFVFIFKVYDSDGNGKVTFNDMLDVLHDLTGEFISEQQREVSS